MTHEWIIVKYMDVCFKFANLLQARCPRLLLLIQCMTLGLYDLVLAACKLYASTLLGFGIGDQGRCGGQPRPNTPKAQSCHQLKGTGPDQRGCPSWHAEDCGGHPTKACIDW
jgi:hypothetical protein